MIFRISALRLAVIFLLLSASVFARKGDVEFTGQFDSKLVSFKEDFERITFKPVAASSVKGSFGANVNLTAARLINPTGQASFVAVLVESEDKSPAIFIDFNGDNRFDDNEKYVFKQEEPDNPYLWATVADVPIQEGIFTVCPIFIRFFKDYQTSEMTAAERLITQTTQALARGTVDIKGKKTLVQYLYSFKFKTIKPEIDWQGIDTNGDGEIDMDNLSPEAARADGETIVFRVGDAYVSTKRVDLKKNLIVMREQSAKDYRRVEFAVGKELPDFSFVDLEGKKRKFSEFRGKYVLLDFWGTWCPPCLRELPYLREAYKKFQSRGLEIVGMNTDSYQPEQIKAWLDKNDIKWTQARHESIMDLKNFEFRIESFPTTFLVAPDGKILSMSREERGEPDLRGKDLLKSLDKILPKNNNDNKSSADEGSSGRPAN